MSNKVIGVIAPFPDFASLCEDVARELDVPIKIKLPTSDKIWETAKAWDQERDVQVIVARGPAVDIITANKPKIPCVRVDITSLDILLAIYNASLLTDKVAVLDTEAHLRKVDYNLMSKMLNFEFNVFTYRNDSQLIKELELCIKSGTEILVCTTNMLVDKANKQGLRGVDVKCQRETIREAFQKAIDIMENDYSNKRANLQLSTILNNSFDGIMVVNDKGLLTMVNPVSEKVLGVRAPNLIGRPALDFPPSAPIARLLGDGSEITNELMEIKGVYLVVSRKPLVVEEQNEGLVITFQEATNVKRIEQKIRKELHTKGLNAKFSFNDIIGHSRAIKQVIEEAKCYARSEGNVLITGESGVGKELFAHAIHKESKRRKGPFVAINCATLPENLLESELFGYEEGAFTGAKKGGKVGLFELAHEGTIFLDEIGELNMHIQARLLRVLQEREIMRIGGNSIIPINVRIIASTNRNLEQAVSEGNFRQDLFFRLNVLSLSVPPLRERREDIPLLFNFFIENLSKGTNVSPPVIPADILEKLSSYDWPGNIRELQGIAERYLALKERGGNYFPLPASFKNETSPGNWKEEDDNSIVLQFDTLERMEDQLILQISKKFKGGKSDLAKSLNISRATLWKRLRKAQDSLGIPI